jgi:hypothetical protein
MTRMPPTTEPAAGPTAEPGERRRLDHPPSDRYQEAGEPAGPTPADGAVEDATAVPLSRTERTLRGIAVALVGALAFVALGGPLSVTAGLVAVAGVIGWLTGMVVRPGKVIAAGLAVASVAVGLVGIWTFAGIEGGALPLLDYLAQVQGLLVPIELAVAGGLAAAAG